MEKKCKQSPLEICFHSCEFFMVKSYDVQDSFPFIDLNCIQLKGVFFSSKNHQNMTETITLNI